MSTGFCFRCGYCRFQVRPSGSARKLADNEEIEIRLTPSSTTRSNDVKAAMEGMLEKEMEEVIVGNAEVREVFRSRKWELWRLHGHGRLCKAQTTLYGDPRRYRSVFREMTALKRFQGGCSE